MNKSNSILISVIALVVAVVALGVSIFKTPVQAPVSETTKAPMENAASVEEVIKNNPQIVVDALQNYEMVKRENAMAEAQKMIATNIAAVNSDKYTPAIANPKGSIVLVEFFDYSCGYCHKLYPALKNIMAANPDVKVLAKPLDFLSPVSQYAAKASLAAAEQGKYPEMYNALFQVEGQLSEAKIDEVAAGLGLDMTKFKADINSETVKKGMEANRDVANKIQVSGVPTMILDGKMLQTIDENVIQEAINQAKAGK